MLDSIWRIFADIVSHPASNRLVASFGGIMMAVLAWKFVPMILDTLPVMNRPRAITKLARGVLSLAAVAGLGFLYAGFVATFRLPGG